MEKKISEGFNSNDVVTEAEAKRARDARAKELRKLGYVVVCKKFSFAGLGYGCRFTLDAKLVETNYQIV